MPKTTPPGGGVRGPNTAQPSSTIFWAGRLYRLLLNKREVQLSPTKWSWWLWRCPSGHNKVGGNNDNPNCNPMNCTDSFILHRSVVIFYVHLPLPNVQKHCCTTSNRKNRCSYPSQWHVKLALYRVVLTCWMACRNSRAWSCGHTVDGKKSCTIWYSMSKTL